MAGIPAVADVPALASVLAVAVLYMVSDVSFSVLADHFCSSVPAFVGVQAVVCCWRTGFC